MELQKQIVKLILVIFLLQTFKSVKTQEVEDESEFSYIEGEENGPGNWSEINKDWAECGEGHMQSPIDLLHERVEVMSDLGRLRRKYRSAPATIMNRGHDIMIKWEDRAGAIYLNGTTYNLKQLHWHSPSEHTLNGKRYALEAHLVHESADKKIAVIGVLYKTGRRPDKYLSWALDHVATLVDKVYVAAELGVVNPKWIIKTKGREYYRYLGSLTTPPCTQGVLWTIFKMERTVSPKQVNLLREAVHDGSEMNARPIQPINSRDINLYTPNDIFDQY